MIEFDIILDKVGHCGPYQIFLVLSVYLLGIPAGHHNIASVFFAASVPYRCHVPPLDDCSVYPNLTESEILNYTTPYIDDEYNGCKRYGYNLSSCQAPNLNCVNKDASPIKCDNGYHFETSVFSYTTNMQWSLVCDHKVLSTIASSIYFAGMWAGAIIFGNLADYIGRRNTMLVSSIGCVISGISVAFAPWFWLFVVLRFFVAAFSHGAFLIMFVYVVEITGKKRTISGVHVHTAFSVGYMLNSLVAYLLRDWRYFYLVITLTQTPYFLIYFLIPDSPRWHFSNGRDAKGKKISEKFAKHNRRLITEKDWDEAQVPVTDAHLLKKTYTSLDLFKTKKMRLITFNCMFQWLVISMVYYGLSLNAGGLAGNIFVNNAINGMMEIMAFLFIQFTMDRFGRRTLLIAFMVLQGLACILSTVFTEIAGDNEALLAAGVAFAFIGKAGVGGTFGVIFNYTAELYPTVIRGNALGVGSMAARVGSIASPYIILLQDYISWLPTTIFGVLSIAAGILATFFPETMKRTMPQTIPEAELFYKKKYAKTDKNTQLTVKLTTE
ncbi:unnamed protein product [Clavelina lepadiformis]|uniref:Major facilitator superfamily (MFS) profile domain-containing protein n=1 Tax=Clavelina lepadiformis TaxID=159417 RepID=A0ABP0FWG8_CLALP